MSKKIIIALLCLVMLFSFASCKSKKGENVSTTASDTTATTVQSKKQETTEKTKSSTEKKAEKSKSKTTTKQTSQSVTKKNDDGTFTINGLKADVVKYSNSSIDDGEHLIKNLIDGGLKNAKIIDSKKADKTIIYIVSGVTSKSDKVYFYKLEYIQDGSDGYLITYRADSQQALNADVSYVTENYKKIAR